MLRLIGVVLSIGLADSLNPSTIAPALYLAGGEHPRARVTQFSVGVFAVYFLGGALIALGPGQLLISLVNKPDAEDRHVIEIVVGVAMIIVALVLWQSRRHLAERQMPQFRSREKSSAILGATITAVELPTAFPYFAAIAAIVSSGLDPVRQLVLLVLFNVCFVLPLIGIVLSLWLAGDKAAGWLRTMRDFLQCRWPIVLSALLLAAGVFVVLLGVTALGSGNRFLRHVHRVLKLK